jgi:hypothetical protein
MRHTFKSFLTDIGVATGATLAALGTRLRAIRWLPKKYSVYKGLHTDWHTRTLDRIRWAVPLIPIVGGIMIMVLLSELPAVKQGHKQPRKPSADTVLNARTVDSKRGGNANKPSTAKAATTTPTTINPAATMNASATAPITSAVSSVPIVGGMGGGDVITTPPVTVPSVPVPDPVVTPVPDPSTILDPVVKPLNQPVQTVENGVQDVVGGVL